MFNINVMMAADVNSMITNINLIVSLLVQFVSRSTATLNRISSLYSMFWIYLIGHWRNFLGLFLLFVVQLSKQFVELLLSIFQIRATVHVPSVSNPITLLRACKITKKLFKFYSYSYRQKEKFPNENKDILSKRTSDKK